MGLVGLCWKVPHLIFWMKLDSVLFANDDLKVMFAKTFWTINNKRKNIYSKIVSLAIFMFIAQKSPCFSNKSASITHCMREMRQFFTILQQQLFNLKFICIGFLSVRLLICNLFLNNTQREYWTTVLLVEKSWNQWRAIAVYQFYQESNCDQVR